MKKIVLTKDKFALVDDEDFDYLNQWKWHALTKKKPNTIRYYACRTIKENGKKKNIYMHRLLMNFPKNKQVDHSDHDTLNNQKSNLRTCTNAQNSYNQNKRIGSSQYKGVHWYKQTKKWVARIMYNYKNISIGYFKSEIEAAKAYDEKAKKLFGEFAYLNFPKEV
ncbi:MAG: AP2 domain-containing protein [Candidatus Thorarchaeota archaeon]